MRGIIGVIVTVLIAVAYAAIDALLSGTSVAEKLGNPIFGSWPASAQPSPGWW